MIQLISTKLIGVTCCECCAAFGLNETHFQQRVGDHKTFWCPACGTKQHFSGKNEIEKLRSQLAEANQKLVAEIAKADQQQSELRDIIEQKELQRRAEKAAKTRLKNRVSNGLCPCCNRFFANVHRHIKHQHPEFCKANPE